MSTQFPPSSPVHEDIRPKRILKQLAEYPSPNPSSETGELLEKRVAFEGGLANKENVPPSTPAKCQSSPLKLQTADEQNVNSSPTKRKARSPRKAKSPKVAKVAASTEETAAALDAAARKVGKVLTINTTEDSDTSIGRSSKVADFSVNGHNKLVSRVHCHVEFSAATSTVELSCQGYNGVNCTVPAAVQVNKVGDEEFAVVLGGKKSTPNDRVLYANPQYTNFYILKDESVKMPAMNGIVLDLRGEVVLLEFKKEQAPAAAATTTTVAVVEKTPEPAKSAEPADRLTTPVNTVSRRSVTPTPEHKRRKAYIREEEKEEKEYVNKMTDEEITETLESVPNLDDLTHVLANHIAYSRLLQVPFGQLLELNPVKKNNLSRLQLRCILVHHIPCIGVIYREGLDAAGLPLDEEYYYIPEKDDDKQRVQLVEDIKGSGSHIRSCRKVHKQYFWKRPKMQKH